MNMKMQHWYWPQHKVFFIATLALFPENLKGFVVTLLFYKPYFARDDLTIIELLLQDYQKEGYIQYEKLSEGGFKIIDVNTQKATDDLLAYLEEWQNNQLTLHAAGKLPDSSHQRKLLLEALIKAYESNPKDQQRLLLEDIYGSPNNDIFGTPFWELVLSLQLSELPQAKINFIGYDRNMSGLYENDAQPYVDFEITDQDLRRTLELAARSSEPITDEDPEEVEYSGVLAARDNTVSYKGVKIPFTRQEVDVMRVFLRRPEELRAEDDFTDPYANVFNANLPDIHTTLSKLISRTRKKLDGAVGQSCITNTSGRGWTLKIHSTE